MDSKPTSRKANQKQFRSVNGKWQFVPVVKFDGKPKPQIVLIDGKSESSKGGGKFYLEWYENGKGKTKMAGASPAEPPGAWQLQTGVLSGKVEAGEDQVEDTDDAVITIDAAIEATVGGQGHERQGNPGCIWSRSPLVSEALQEVVAASSAACWSPDPRSAFH